MCIRLIAPKKAHFSPVTAKGNSSISLEKYEGAMDMQSGQKTMNKPKNKTTTEVLLNCI